MAELEIIKIFATGRRKEATATARLKEGTGKIIVNKRDLNEYFGRKDYIYDIKRVLDLAKWENKYDIIVKATGGGTTGQAEAIRLAIAKLLVQLNPNLKPVLKKEGLLKRDPRAVERKKYGRPKARKRFQWTKR